MEEDAFDDNGWSRFFAPDVQIKVDPHKAEDDLIHEQFTSGIEDEKYVVEEVRGAECMIRAEDGGNEIETRMSIPDQQKKVGDSNEYHASLDAERCENSEEILQKEPSLHVVRVNEDRCENNFCEITPLDIDGVKHTVSATECSRSDPLSSRVKEEDDPSTKEKAAAESNLFESLPPEEDKDENNITAAEGTGDSRTKSSFEGSLLRSLSLEKTDKDKIRTREGKAVGKEAKATTKSPLVEYLSLKKKDKYKNNTEKGEKVTESQTKAATNSPHIGFSLFERTRSFIFLNAFQLIHKLISFTPWEKDKIRQKFRSCYISAFAKSLEMKDEEESKTRETIKAAGDWPEATTELCQGHTKSSRSKSYERKSSAKLQTAESTTAIPEVLSEPFKLLNSRFPLFLSMLLSVSFQAAGGTLVVSPKDVIGLKGENIRLLCSTQHPNTVYWERILVGSKEQQTIYFGINGMVNIDGANGRIKIDSDPATGRYDLVIEDLQPMDAATYICIGDNGIGEEKRAQLIVLDYFSCHMPMPHNGYMGENTVNLPVDDIQASCNLQYHGHVTPRIEWRMNNIQVIASHAINGSTVKSVVTLRGTKELHDVQLSSLPTISRNSDSDSYSEPWWTSAQLKVNYIHLELGEVAECRIDSAMVPVCVPSCKYQQVMIPEDELCHCVAIYNMDGANYDITFNKHPCQGSDFTSDKSMIIIVVCVVGATVFGVLVGVIIVLIIKIKRSKSSKERRGVGANKLLS